MSLFLSRGSFGKKMFRKVAEDVSFRRSNANNEMCKVGLEFDFKGDNYCDNRRRKKMDLSDQGSKNDESQSPPKVWVEIHIKTKYFEFHIKIG